MNAQYECVTIEGPNGPIKIEGDPDIVSARGLGETIEAILGGRPLPDRAKVMERSGTLFAQITQSEIIVHRRDPKPDGIGHQGPQSVDELDPAARLLGDVPQEILVQALDTCRDPAVKSQAPRLTAPASSGPACKV